MSALARLPSLHQIHYGWWLMLASGFGIAVSSALLIWNFGLYIDPIEQQFGWTRAEVSFAITVAFIASGLSSPLVGKWTDRYGPRSVILVGAIVGLSAYGLLSITATLWQWYLFYALVGVSLAMTFVVPFQALASRWFSRRRGAALGILAVGISLGGIAGVPIFRILIAEFGWDVAFLISAASLGGVLIPLALLVVRNDPIDRGLGLDGAALDPGQAAAIEPQAGLTLRAAIRTPIFWSITLGVAAFFYASFGFVIHTIPLFESEGVSTAGASTILSIMAASGILSRVLFSWLVDRGFRYEYVGMLVAGGGAAAAFVLLGDTGLVAIAVFILFWSINEGGPALLEPLAVVRTFGPAHFGTILGTVGFIRIGIMVSAPTVAGAIFDATGSYDLALVLFIGIFALAIALFALTLRLPRPRGAPSR